MDSGRWLNDQTGHRKNVLLSWYLQLFGVLASSVIKTTMEKVKPELVSASWVLLLRLLFPKTEKSNLNRPSTSFINASGSGVKW
ncbi:anaphase-promoting complex [Salix suchowensis]|nr:anaphase-promoting complex [Salix suchowensis]